MALILLDSSVIFDHLNRRFGRTQFLEQLIEQGHVLVCCPVNLTEVYAGLRPGEEEKTATFMDSLECLPVTPEIARQAGLLAEEGPNPFLCRCHYRRSGVEQRHCALN